MSVSLQFPLQSQLTKGVILRRNMGERNTKGRRVLRKKNSGFKMQLAADSQESLGGGRATPRHCASVRGSDLSST